MRAVSIIFCPLRAGGDTVKRIVTLGAGEASFAYTSAIYVFFLYLNTLKATEFTNSVSLYHTRALYVVRPFKSADVLM